MSKFKTTLTALCILALAAPVAHAATIGAEVFGAFNTYSMQDVNDGIQQANSLGANFDKLSNSMGGGLGMRVWPNQQWMIEGSWEPLFVQSESKLTSSTLNMNANSFQVSAYRFFPSSSPNTRFGIGGGAGMYSVSGESKVSSPTPSTTKTEGSGPGFQVMGVGEWTMSPSFNVTGSAGYRFADIEIDGSNPKTTADYSGFMGRVGLAFYFPQGK